MKKLILSVGIVLTMMSCSTNKVKTIRMHKMPNESGNHIVTIIRSDLDTDLNVYTNLIAQRLSDSTSSIVYETWSIDNDTVNLTLRNKGIYIYTALPVGNTEHFEPVNYQLYLDGKLIRSRKNCKEDCQTIFVIN